MICYRKKSVLFESVGDLNGQWLDGQNYTEASKKPISYIERGLRGWIEGSKIAERTVARLWWWLEKHEKHLATSKNGVWEPPEALSSLAHHQQCQQWQHNAQDRDGLLIIYASSRPLYQCHPWKFISTLTWINIPSSLSNSPHYSPLFNGLQSLSCSLCYYL